MAGKLTWRPKRVIWPVRFTHDARGDGLLHQPGRRRSRWFEVVMTAQCVWGTGYMPAALAAKESAGE